MDGGSVFLKATDATGRLLDISLDWSIAAKNAGATLLMIDGVKIQPGSKEEAQWVEWLRSAQITDDDDPPIQPTSRPKRVVLAPDAKAYLEAIDRGPQSALAALRDDLIQKLQSPLHRREPRKSGPLPLP